MSETALRLHDDPGLQPERTALAWNRTTVSLALVSMIWLRWSHTFGGTVLVMIGLMVASAVVLHGTQRARYRKAARGLAEERIHADIRGVLFMTACMTSFGIGGIVLILS